MFCWLLQHLAKQPILGIFFLIKHAIVTVHHCILHLNFISSIVPSNLDETTRSVYKENIRINAALEYHMTESKDLRKVQED